MPVIEAVMLIVENKMAGEPLKEMKAYYLSQLYKKISDRKMEVALKTKVFKRIEAIMNMITVEKLEPVSLVLSQMTAFVHAWHKEHAAA